MQTDPDYRNNQSRSQRAALGALYRSSLAKNAQLLVVEFFLAFLLNFSDKNDTFFCVIYHLVRIFQMISVFALHFVSFPS